MMGLAVLTQLMLAVLDSIAVPDRGRGANGVYDCDGEAIKTKYKTYVSGN